MLTCFTMNKRIAVLLVCIGTATATAGACGKDSAVIGDSSLGEGGSGGPLATGKGGSGSGGAGPEGLEGTGGSGTGNGAGGNGSGSGSGGTEGGENGSEGGQGGAEGGEGGGGTAGGETGGNEGAEGTEVVCKEANVNAQQGSSGCPTVECDPEAEFPFELAGTWMQTVAFDGGDCPDDIKAAIGEGLASQDAEEIELASIIFGTCIVDPQQDCRPIGSFAATFKSGTMCFGGGGDDGQGGTIPPFVIKLTSIQEDKLSGNAELPLPDLDCTLTAAVNYTRK